MIKRISIIGLGVMGGSFGLSLRRTRTDLHITGIDSTDVLDRAIDRGAITLRASSVVESVRDADLVMLCAPVLECVNLIPEIAPHIKQDAIISDVCSVKVPLVQAANEALDNPSRFIGGHPMTGTEKSGINHADEFLFENATYVLCPPSGIDGDVFKSHRHDFIELIEATGGRVLLMDAEKHDRIAARISHLPQLLAIALVNAVGKRTSQDPEMVQLAAGGFRDMTRIASSSFQIWEEILVTNSARIQEALDSLSIELNELRTYLENGDYDAIESLFNAAEKTRTSIPQRSKGFLRPLSELFVFVSDRPGAIFDMTGRLSEADLNIKDIELLKIREGTGGTFRIGLENEKAAEYARTVLTQAGYRVHRL